MTTSDLQQAFHDHKLRHGHASARAALKRACGATALSEVPPNKWDAVIRTLNGTDSPKQRPATVEALVAPAFAKFNEPRGRTG